LNLNTGNPAAEYCEHAVRYAKDQGCEVVLDKTQDLDGELFEKVTKHGFNVVEALDDGTVVLALTTNEEISIKSVKVDAVPCPSEDNSRSNFRGAAVQVPEVDFKWLKKDFRVPLEDNLRADNQDQKFFGEFFFQAAHGREGDTRWVRLVLMECSFGVEDCFNDDNKRGLFVYKVTTTATPSGTWCLQCDKLICLPTPKARDFTREESFTGGVGSGFSHSNPVNVMIQRQWKRAVTAREFDWMPCRFTGKPTRSVTWPWEMQSWRDGKSFKLEKPSSFVLGALPKLPRNYDPKGFAQGTYDFVADACWRIPNMSEEDLGNVEWDIVIQLHFAYVKKGWKAGPLIFYPRPINFSIEFKSSVKLDL